MVMRTAHCPLGINAAPQLREPAFQNPLVVRLNLAELDSHSIRSRIGYVPQSSECGASVINPQSDFRSPGKRSLRLDEAAEGAQVASLRRKLPFQSDVNHFHSGRKLVARGTMLLNLHP